MGVEHRPESQSQAESSSDRQGSFAAALNNVVETLFTSEAITERLRGHESDQFVQMFLAIHKQALTEQFAETAEQAVEGFLSKIDGLQASPGVPLYPPLPALREAEVEPRINALNRYRPFTVASICREDLRGILAEEEIARLDDGEMESIADRMSNVLQDSGGYWESLEIMARFVLDKDRVQDIAEGGHT